MTDTDVLIQGTGTAALAAAVMLVRGGLTVTLIEGIGPEGAAGEQPAPPEPGPVSLLDTSAERILRRLGAWRRIQAHAIDTLELEDTGSRAHLVLEASEIGERRLGHVLETGQLQPALRELLEALPGGRCLAGARIDAYTVDQHQVQVRLSDARSLRARVLIAADGIESPLRGLAGIPWQCAGYGQEALLARVQPQRPPGHTIRQCLQGEAALTLLPVNDREAMVLWPLPRARTRQLKEAEATVLAHRLTEASGAMLGPIERVASHRSLRLLRGRAKRYTAPRLALIGNAAHTIHPLTGQAANLALLDAATLAESLLEAQQAGRDPGGLGPLRRYERRRRAHNQRIQTGVDLLQWALEPQRGPWLLLRGTGLRALATAAPLRRACLRALLEVHGDLPGLAQGPEV